MTIWNRWPISQRSMGISVILPTAERGEPGESTSNFENLLELTSTVESSGLDAIWIADHFLIRPPVADEGDEFGCWEAWTLASALAQATSRIQIGLLVTCLGWRNPGIVARMTETIDEISNGRFILGVGAGWHEPEYTAFGFPFDHRASRFEDAMTILDSLLRTGKANHDGEFFSADNATSQPLGPRGQQGGVPVIVGTHGARMLGLTAMYADAWNTCWHGSAESAKSSFAALDEACTEAGRDPTTIVKTAGINIALSTYNGDREKAISGDAQAIAHELIAFRETGFSHVIANLLPCTVASVQELAEVVRLFDQT